jgi:uncharacterized membrane protein
MRLDIFKLVESVRASYWFVPSVMAAIALVLGLFTVWLDAEPGSDWLSGLGWYQSVKPDGAHEVLSTIAGSMITVAGVVFSITIVALAYASSQYGPRVLTNFMSDRGNQVTLGTFIATFVYCLVVLRTIRGGDEEFVPQLAVMVGLLFAFCSIGVLIYFIHHVPQSIHVNNVVARVGTQLIDGVEARFPAFIGDAPDPEEEVKNPSEQAVAVLMAGERRDEVATVRSRTTGYIQAVDEEVLLAVTRDYDIVLRLHYRPGDYLHAGRALLEVWPAERLTDRAADELRAAYIVGNKRTPRGDLNFLIDELVEIAARALSTGVNDPYTANTCLDWLGAGASEIARRRIPEPQRADKDGTVRVIALPDSFAAYIDRAFAQMRQYVARDMNAALHTLRTLGEVAAACRSREQLETLKAESERLVALAQVELNGAGLEAVCARGAELQAMLATSVTEVESRQADWLGGTASTRAEPGSGNEGQSTRIAASASDSASINN